MDIDYSPTIIKKFDDNGKVIAIADLFEFDGEQVAIFITKKNDLAKSQTETNIDSINLIPTVSDYD
jgi:hypothetical protein